MTPPHPFAGRCAERRTAARRACSPGTTVWVTDVFEQLRSAAGPWNLSTGGTALVVEAPCSVGMRVMIELHHPGRDDPLLAAGRVEHMICCPSFKELWLTGYSFLDRLDDAELYPFAQHPNRR